MSPNERVPFEISSKILKEALKAGSKNVYELSSILGWSYGKTIKIVNKLLDSKDLFAKELMSNGHATKTVSLAPFHSNENKESKDDSKKEDDLEKEKKIRAETFRKQGFKCAVKGCNEMRGHLHHINSQNYYPKFKFEEWNVVGLCVKHHLEITNQLKNKVE